MANEVNWTRKDLIDIYSLSKEEIFSIFSTTTSFKETFNTYPNKLSSLAGKTIINLFIEPSTRTRLSFEIAAKNLSAHVINVDASSSSFTKGESLKDTILNLQSLNAHALIIRHACAGAPYSISQDIPMPVINAGDGAHAHPTQALLDAFTLLEHFKTPDLSNKKITILGDILFSRVARSNIRILKKLGAHVTLAGPSTLVPKTFQCMDVEICHDLKTALAQADAIILLRIQHERQSSTHFPSLNEYTQLFGLNSTRASWLKPNAVILHPGPINRGVEIDSHLADSAQALILTQVNNGIFIRMAVLYLCIAAVHTVDNF